MLTDDLRKIVLDPRAFFAGRKVAGEILVEVDDEIVWPTVLRTLCSHGDELSVRLAIELADEIGYKQFDVNLIVDLVSAYARSGSRTIGVLMHLEKHLPDAQIADVLDRLAVVATILGNRHERPGNDALTDLAYHLIVRSVAAGSATAGKLWSWLEPFHINAGYQREIHQRLHELIRRNDELRQSVQRLVLLELGSDHSPFQQARRLSERSTGFMPSDSDVVALLNCLDPANNNDERWRDVIQLTRHGGEAGAEVRATARRFTALRPDLLEWIDKLTEQTIPDWQIEQTERERQRCVEQMAAHAGHRNYFASCTEQMLAGDYASIIDPAKAYLNLFNDIEKLCQLISASGNGLAMILGRWRM